MNQIILKMIHDRAQASFGEEIHAANYKRYEEHWFQTAEDIRLEFENEGLYHTAHTVANMIVIMKRNM
jgi:hypothetical protein